MLAILVTMCGRSREWTDRLRLRHSKSEKCLNESIKTQLLAFGMAQRTNYDSVSALVFLLKYFGGVRFVVGFTYTVVWRLTDSPLIFSKKKTDQLFGVRDGGFGRRETVLFPSLDLFVILSFTRVYDLYVITVINILMVRRASGPTVGSLLGPTYKCNELLFLLLTTVCVNPTSIAGYIGSTGIQQVSKLPLSCYNHNIMFTPSLKSSAEHYPPGSITYFVKAI